MQKMSEIYGVGKWSKIQKTENVMYFYYVGKFAKSETAVSFLHFAPNGYPIDFAHFLHRA